MSYIYDATSIYNTKSDVDPPVGSPDNNWAAVDANAVKTAFETDTRNAILAGKGFGFTEQASAPVVGGMSTFIWDKTDGNLFLHRGGVDLNIPAAAVSAKGDILVYTGSIWSKLVVGSNTQVLTADSTQTTGLKWAAAAASSTLASTYTAGASQTDSTLLLNSTALGMRIWDNASPITGNLFEVASASGTTKYLAMTPTVTQLNGKVAIAGPTVANFTPTPVLHIKGAAETSSYIRIEDATGGASFAAGATDAGGCFIGSISGAFPLALRYNNTNVIQMTATTVFQPVTDNSVNLGDSTHRWANITSNQYTGTQVAAASGTAPILETMTPGAHTGLTASSEVVDVNYALNRTVQRATGAVTINRSFQIQAPTFSFVGGSTINDAATLYVSGPPIAGTNGTITRPYGIMLDNGGGIWMRDAASPTTNNWLLFNSNNAATTYLKLTSSALTSTNLIWDITNSRLGLGDQSFAPSSTFHLKGSSGSTAFMRVECTAAPGATGLFGATDSPQGAFAGSLGSYSMYIRYNNTNTLELNSTALFRPVTDATVALGDATHRYLSLFTGQPSLGTTLTNGLTIENTTAATGVATQQISPVQLFTASYWNGSAAVNAQTQFWQRGEFISSVEYSEHAFRNVFSSSAYVEGHLFGSKFGTQGILFGKTSSGVTSAPKPCAFLTGGAGVFEFDSSTYFGFFSASSANVGQGGGTERLRIDTSNITASLAIIPTTNNTLTVGSSTKVFNQVWATAYGGVEQTVNAAATISPDPAAGEYIRIALGATGITTVNAPTGKPGQRITTAIIQDGTGGRTITGWSANWVFSSAYTASSGINKRDILYWVWDNTAAKWYETAGRTVNV